MRVCVDAVVPRYCTVRLSTLVKHSTRLKQTSQNCFLEDVCADVQRKHKSGCEPHHRRISHH